jgi:hypothetical protein
MVIVIAEEYSVLFFEVKGSFWVAIPKNHPKLGHFFKHKILFGWQYLKKQQN